MWNTSRKTLGAFAAVAALAVAIPTAGIAYADDPTTTVKPPRDPEGPGCDAYKAAHPSGSASFPSMATVPASQAIANNPDLSTFSSALSGSMNPAVNVAAVLDNGPYVVFAPTNEAFEKLDPAKLASLKTNAAELTSLVYYHMALGLLTPKSVAGKMTSQEGPQLTITGSGGNITVDDAKVVCGGITAANAQIYMIDTVLDPAASQGAIAAAETTTTTTSSEATPTSTSESTPTRASEATTSSGSEATPSSEREQPHN